MRRLPATLLILGYLAATAWFFALHVAGDAGRGPAAYFWTWDMYPVYETASTRRIVVARTAANRWVRLLPDASHRFRLRGETGDESVDGVPLPRGLARIDLNRREPFLRQAVAAALERWRRYGRGEPIRRVVVVDCYWPSKHNLPEEWQDPNSDGLHSRPRYWRVAAEAAVDAGGAIAWHGRSPRRDPL